MPEQKQLIIASFVSHCQCKRPSYLAVVDDDVEEGVHQQNAVRKYTARIQQHWL